MRSLVSAMGRAKQGYANHTSRNFNSNSAQPTKLSSVARQPDERPRKTLGYETPAKKFN